MRVITIIPAFFVILSSISFTSFSQIREVNFLKGGVDDAQLLFKEYLTPYANIFGANLNGGWYNTAKPHKPLGFDITISVSTAWAPPSAKNFDLALLNLQALTDEGASTITPTVSGKMERYYNREQDAFIDRPELYYETLHPVTNEPVEVIRYRMPNGTGLNALPLPMGQLGIGLPFGTEITGRFLPSINFGDAGNIGLWGIGLKHSIIQWIPMLKRQPVLDVTAQGGYTSLLTYANLNFTPEELDAQEINPESLRYKNQKIELGVKALTFNLIISQTLPVITFYQGIGYSSSNTNVALKGNYPFVSLDNEGNRVVTDDDVITDPFNVEIQNSKDLRLNAGFRIKLGLLTIHGDYTKANYSVLTAGVGISFR